MVGAVTWTDEWQVFLIAAQLVVLVIAALVAWRQVREAREARELRLEQNRPFVVVDFIDAYKERLIAGGKLSNRTIVRHLTVLHGIFKRAGRKWGLQTNPAAADLVERPTVTYTGEFDTLTRDEVELLAANAATSLDVAMYPSPLTLGSGRVSSWRCAGSTSISSSASCTSVVTSRAELRKSRRASGSGRCR